MGDTAPATKKDLADLREMTKKDLAEMEARLVEQIGDSQTELLRGFEKFQTGNNVRMRKLEADLSNLDTSATMRLASLEERVLDIELSSDSGSALSWSSASRR